MHFLKRLFFVIVLFCSLVGAAHGDSYSDTVGVFKNAEASRSFFNSAYGYAVFPLIGKGGVFVGGAFGEGRVYRRGEFTGTVEMSKLSLGFQFGGQVFSQIIFFQDARAYDEFIRGNFEFDASISAVAITAGAQARLGTQGGSAGASGGPRTGVQAHIGYYRGMAVFVHAKGGLMYELAIGGQRFEFSPVY